MSFAIATVSTDRKPGNQRPIEISKRGVDAGELYDSLFREVGTNPRSSEDESESESESEEESESEGEAENEDSGEEEAAGETEEDQDDGASGPGTEPSAFPDALTSDAEPLELNYRGARRYEELLEECDSIDAKADLKDKICKFLEKRLCYVAASLRPEYDKLTSSSKFPSDMW